MGVGALEDVEAGAEGALGGASPSRTPTVSYRPSSRQCRGVGLFRIPTSV